MKKETKTLLQKLLKLNISKELLADKLGVSSITIYRWSKGASSASFTERKVLKRILNGKLQKRSANAKVKT